jgi:hypothetical protein
MEKEPEKKCNVNEFQVGRKYRCFLNTFYVTSIDILHGYVYITWNRGETKGLIYLGTEFYAYEVPLSSLEKELL